MTIDYAPVKLVMVDGILGGRCMYLNKYLKLGGRRGDRSNTGLISGDSFVPLLICGAKWQRPGLYQSKSGPENKRKRKKRKMTFGWYSQSLR